MSQLKEINGRYYQEAEVIMLATDKRTRIDKIRNSLKYSIYLIPSNAFSEFQHLYILSNEEIKEGDWVMSNTPLCPRYFEQVTKEELERILGNWKNGTDKKIIATTDKSLKIESELDAYYRNGIGEARNLPQPSDSFIKKFIKEYNQDNRIKKMLVEYENIKIKAGQYSYLDIKQLKTDSNNQITLKKIEPELYTREQVEKLLIDLWAADLNKRQEIEDWIKEKL